MLNVLCELQGSCTSSDGNGFHRAPCTRCLRLRLWRRFDTPTELPLAERVWNVSARRSGVHVLYGRHAYWSRPSKDTSIFITGDCILPSPFHCHKYISSFNISTRACAHLVPHAKWEFFCALEQFPVTTSYWRVLWSLALTMKPWLLVITQLVLFVN